LAACYQRNALANGRMRVGDRPVRLREITAEVLRISGRRDVIAPPHQMARAQHVPTAATCTIMHVPAGHVGMTAGPTSHTAVYEPLHAGSRRARPDAGADDDRQIPVTASGSSSGAALASSGDSNVSVT
jgi:poly(3-hydroxyalkanoate) synthetase